MNFTSQSRKGFKILLAAVALGVGAVAFAAPAEARMGMGGMGGMGGGGFHGGMGMGGFHGGMGGFGGFHPPIFMHQGFHPGFSPGFAGHPFVGNRVAFGNHPFFFHDHHRFNDNAFAVGLLGGAVLGGPAYDYPYYGYPYYGATYGGDCYVIHRRVVNPWGHIVLRRAVVCG